MRIRDLGEEGLIERFSKEFKSERCEGLMVSIGDDCAVYRLEGGGYLLLSIDTVLEGTHIPREMTPEQLGAYTVNVALSDIAAMGGRPLGVVCSMVLPGGLEVEWAEQLARGLEGAARRNGTCIVGGDTQEGKTIALTAAAVGTAQEGGLLLRKGASVGDRICVTGELGSAAAGFHCLTPGISNAPFIKRALEPKARLKEGLAAAGYASAAMDISDGLAWTLHEIGRQSRVGSLAYEDKIPINPGLGFVAAEVGVSTEELIFYKGGDFELLLTVPEKEMGALEKAFKRQGLELFVIGEVTKGGHLLQTREGKRVEIEKRGWQAFQ